MRVLPPGRSSAVPSPAGLLALLALVFLGYAQAEAEPRASNAKVAPGGGARITLPAITTTWKEVDRLIDEQKLAEAARIVEALEARARDAGDDGELARALVRSTQLGIALGGYETAVEALRAKPWPSDPLARAAVELYDAHALRTYLDAYGWEIARRERVLAGDALDLRLWTRDQIAAEVDRDFSRVWALRETLGEASTKSFALLEANDYPEEIRPTLRDAVAYLWSDQLADSSGWTPAELQELWKLDLDALVDGTAVEPTPERLAEADVHPLAKMAAVLGDLERSHRGRREPGAALEARLERLGRLFDAVSVEEDRARIRAALEDALPEFASHPWWGTGMARLAAFWRQSPEADALVRARQIALDGEARFPASPGARACRRVREEIEAPSYQLQSMAVDAAARRSLEIVHRNLERLHLRAYRLPEAPFEETPYRREGWRQEAIRRILATDPAASWSVDLPPSGDFRDHRTFSAPPLAARGRYLVVASARADFAAGDNLLQAVELTLSDLVVLGDWTPVEASDRLVLRALSGDTGAPLAGAVATLYAWQWERRPQRLATAEADATGRVEFAPPPDVGRAGGFTVVVRHDGDEARWEANAWAWRTERDVAPILGTLVFTDRAVYRPGQTLLWKTLTYERSSLADGSRASRGRALIVRLRDANGEVVAERGATTNEFGTASGEFALPAGRLLGGWSLECDANGGASIAVEEYKRPSFEVTLAAPVGEARLNRPVEVVGEARYYFGLPVTSGRVAWRVVREPFWPWHGRIWSPFWQPEPPRTIASGTAELDADGRFTVRFTPEADARERMRAGAFRFTLSAELTDDGGETRGGSRSIPLGWVGVGLELEPAPLVVGPASEPTWRVRRSGLDDTPRPGVSRWRIVELTQPERAPLPAELPEPVDPSRARYATPGDHQRPRWAHAPSTAELLATWPAGRDVATGELRHGEDGGATLQRPELAAGAYRLVVESLDAHGETARLESSFAVVEADRVALASPLELAFETPRAAVGSTARMFVHSGRPGQTIVVEITRRGRIAERHTLVAGRDANWLAVPIESADRGGIGARAAIVADHQIVQRQAALEVPWDDKALSIEISSFRDTVEPGATETYRVAVKDASGRALGAGAAEIVASMYDRSLDLFGAHSTPRGESLWPAWGAPGAWSSALGAVGVRWQEGRNWWRLSEAPSFRADAFVAIDPYGVGGPGARGPRMMAMRGALADQAAPAPQPASAKTAAAVEERLEMDRPATPPPAPSALRTDFAETAFWRPHLVTDADGAVAIEFRVPESLTSWRLWVSAWTRELASGYLEREVRAAKELMVRPYLPRFLREGDTAELKVVVQNGAARELAGEARFAVVDPDSGRDLSAELGLPAGGGRAAFTVAPGRGVDLVFPVTAPAGARPLAFRVEAAAGGLRDGELRPMPLLPARLRLAQSRFVAVHGGERRELELEDLRASDPTRTNEQLVVTVDGQLFYGLLDALPYLVDYPYECSEQTLNRFVSTAILGALFDRYPAVGEMARSLAERDVKWERFDGADPNRRMALEETPWLRPARGSTNDDEGLLRVLDPDVARAVRVDALAKLERIQLPSGAFPWFPGGPPSPYITLYLLAGFARAAEFGVEIPVDLVQRGWRYLAGEIERDWWRHAIAEDCCWELLTFANYVASTYPDPAVMGDVLPVARRREILDFSFRHWKRHAPQSKLQLALTLSRFGRARDARLVLDAIFDSAKTDRDLGTYWAPEERAWLWYNDTIETHAWALRALSEIVPDDPRREGLVQWLFLNKKLGHWKSTKATAEVLYAVASDLARSGRLGAGEALSVTVGGRTTDFTFAPDRFTGRKNQIVLSGDEIVPARDAITVVESSSEGLAFVSSTWTYTTDRLPEAGRGDLFAVERRWYRRVQSRGETTLVPLAQGERLSVGDELEVQLSIRARAAAEYVHLRDPRPAGLEPGAARSGWRWELGVAYFEETRDSGTNFFFERLPAGEFTLRYRVRAAVAGAFQGAPAELQSMYAPEFVAHSAGARLEIAP